MTRRLTALGFLLSAASLVGGASQARATLTGVVVSADSAPQPIPGAVVSISGGEIRDNLSVLTDEAGRFTFANIPPGRYKISASKPAYLTAMYGASRPGRPGSSIAAEGGKTVEVRLALPRGAVIAGTIRDQLGDPAPGVDVLLLRFTAANPGTQVIEDVLTTDDRGMYRAFGLMPDEYVIAALPARFFGNADTFAPSREEVDAKLRRLEQRFAQTQTVNPSAGSGSGRGEKPAPAETPLVIGQTYYPGASSAGDAVPVRVAAGEERLGIDMRLTLVRTVKVSGIIQSGQFSPQRVRPQLVPMGTSSILGAPSLIGPAADGSFTFGNVTPGRYAVFARVGPGLATPFPIESGDGPTPSLYGITEISVADTDVTGVVLSLRSAPALTGRVVFDGATTKPPVNMEIVRLVLGAVRIGAAPLNLSINSGGFTNARGDGTFTFNSVLPGAYSLTSSMSGWWLRSAIANGRDILDLPLQVDPAASDLPPVVVTYTDRRTELLGTLMTASGQPPSEFVVVVYPVTREFWRPGARRIRSVRPGSDGAFSVADLPAGEYFLAAVTDADPDEWQQPAFLEQLVPASIKVSITEGQKTRQDLRIARD